MAKLAPPSTLKEYLGGYKNLGYALNWFSREVINQKSKRYLYEIVAFNFCLIALSAISQATAGLVITGLSKHAARAVLTGLAGTGTCLVLNKAFDRKKNKIRELITTSNWLNMDKRLLEMFFAKSAGQHVQGTTLSTSALNRGRSHLVALQGIMLYEVIPTTINLLVAIILLSWVAYVAGVLMVFCIVGYAICGLYLNYRVITDCPAIDRRWRKYSRHWSDRLDKIARVLTTAQENREVDEMIGYFEETARMDNRFWLWFIDTAKWRGYNNIFFYLAVFGYCTHLAWDGKITLGLCMTITGWAKSIVDSVWTLAEAEQKLSWTLPSIAHTLTTLSHESETPDAPDAIEIPRDKPLRIVVRDVSYAYTKNDSARDPEETEDGEDEKDVEEGEFHTLRGASFTIEPGEKVAIIGPSGAGKTTLERLILRYMDPISGAITVDGHDLRQIRRSSWMKCIGHIAQHPEVFDGTIRENLTYRLTQEERERTTDEELWALMRRLQIDFGQRLSEGLETRVGKHGLKLSGGQAQRLMIGAAVIGRPWFMVIDEATSSLDSTTERKVQKGLEESLTKDTSALIVAHRLSTVRRLCTKFIVLKPAADVAEGESQVEAIGSSFEDLYRISPTFKELADDQEIVLEVVA